ncbi:hypothetical protein [Janthinobacterium agaricidamnosum]|uniref:Uncharacterized protein n=1 Tax=Janthinobacterium agaricidamnosum NBRC 102515 = DSM 9628 TaxID=1349767 RepID=W0VDN6_9BURK|nr:hypothetical protein [Janthinobacterium agaricidamnosum]CDG85785.1 hypothetical protein GJA_5188 [Janthinobacterium agaricidamnosum NBRC 102515 = DSM 9628]
MSKPKDVTLIVGFDADQVSDQLAYQFISADGGQPVHPTGLFKGEIFFNEGEIFHLQVRGGGKRSTFTSFQVIDCAIVTLPKIVSAGEQRPTRYAAPSPFLQATGACYPLALDFASDTVLDELRGYRLIKQDWKHTLDVSNTPGRWEISVVITVRIFRNVDQQPEIRVFSFDPEGQVGPGRGSD